MTTYVNINPHCVELREHPFEILGYSILVGYLIIPGIGYFFRSDNGYDRRHMDPDGTFDVPGPRFVSISRTWLEPVSYVSVPVTSLSMLIYYGICLTDWAALLVFSFAVLQVMLVLIFNGEKRGKYHSMFAILLFTYLLAVMLAMTTLYVGWYVGSRAEPGSSISVTNSVIYILLFANACYMHLIGESKEFARFLQYMWPNWLAILEISYIVLICVFLISITGSRW